jgi:23S rRNA (uracil1939-C5)-methyltransferase
MEFKQNRLLEELWTLAGITARDVLPPMVGTPWGYRRKARLSVKYVQKKGGALVGFREKFSNKVADVSRCETLHSSVGLRLESIRETISSLEACDRIPQIEVAVGDRSTALVIRHLTKLSATDRETLRELAISEGFEVHLQSGGPESVSRLWPPHAGPLSYALTDYALELRHGPTDFAQVNAGINRDLVSKAIELVSPEAGDRILDLFCGIGNFTLALARFAKRTIGLEGSRVLVERARENAHFNAIENAEFHVVDLDGSVAGTAWVRARWDKIFLDPPRVGALEVLNTLEAPYPSRVVYVSCNPTTLARDAAILVDRHGYVLESVGVVDMFPHTNHVESIALFEHV